MAENQSTYNSNFMHRKEMCPVCSRVYTSRTRNQAAFFACKDCLNLINLQENKKEKATKFNELLIYPFLELGEKGTFDNVEYEIVGIILYKDSAENYYWYEYTLFHPIDGYRILSHATGHWNLFKSTSNFPKIPSTTTPPSIHSAGRNYIRYTKYFSNVLWASGEFTYNICKNNSPAITEWINPPHILVREFDSEGVSWFEGKYYEPKEIQKAFNSTKEFPPKKYIAGSQPFYIKYTSTFFVLFHLLFFIALFLTVYLWAENKTIYSEVFVPEYDSTLTTFKPIITEPFKVETGPFSNNGLDVALYSNVDNNWFEAQITLINDDTDDEYDLEVGVEYYFGYDDGNWTEGSKNSDKFVSEISPGTYHMVIVPYPNSSLQLIPFSISAIQNPTIWSNFWWLFIISLIFPSTILILKNSFEADKWADSEYQNND